MAFYLRRLCEAERSDIAVLTNSTANLSETTVSDSGSAAFTGSDTVDLATLRTAVRALQTSLAEVQAMLKALIDS